MYLRVSTYNMKLSSKTFLSATGIFYQIAYGGDEHSDY